MNFRVVEKGTGMDFDEWVAVTELDFLDIGCEPSAAIQGVQCPAILDIARTVHILSVNGNLYKLNGFRRKAEWLKSNAPSKVIPYIVTLSEEEFDSLCTSCKNTWLNNLPPHELVREAFKVLSLEFNSERIRNGFITEAIHIVLRGKQRSLQNRRTAHEREEIDMFKAINVFKDELLIIDQLNPKTEIFSSGVLAGAIIMLVLFPESIRFLNLLNNGEGVSIENQFDPIMALTRITVRHKLSTKALQPRETIELCRKTVQAISNWLEGSDSTKYWRIRDLNGVDLHSYVLDVRKMKKINAERDL
ncbi:hypothetical protein [Methylomonas sp. AM2-LC]|uniref:hypothetical protein n=1 Tax=Methylomonas sp. AM2-LC TaxID=3153301 RepID=UPI00326645BC